MENKAHAMAAGLFVALLSLLVLGFASWLTRETGVRDVYEISTKEAVSGLQEQAPVRYLGVDVGKVTDIGFDPRMKGHVLLRLKIDRDTPLTKATYATLSYQGVTGLAYIQLADDEKNGQAAPRLVPNDENPPRIPLRPGLLQRLEEKGEVFLEQMQEVAERVNRVLGDKNQERFANTLENLSRTAESANVLARHMDDTVTRQLDPAIREARTTLKGLQKTMDQVGDAANQFGQTAQRLNARGGPMDRLSEGTDALANAAESFSAGTLPRINRATEQATRTLRSLDRAIDDLTENPQALLFGEGKPRPGPGEPGFQASGAAR